MVLGINLLPAGLSPPQIGTPLFRRLPHPYASGVEATTTHLTGLITLFLH